MRIVQNSYVVNASTPRVCSLVNVRLYVPKPFITGACLVVNVLDRNGAQVGNNLLVIIPDDRICSVTIESSGIVLSLDEGNKTSRLILKDNIKHDVIAAVADAWKEPIANIEDRLLAEATLIHPHNAPMLDAVNQAFDMQLEWDFTRNTSFVEFFPSMVEQIVAKLEDNIK